MWAATILEVYFPFVAVSGSRNYFILGTSSSCKRTDGRVRDEAPGIEHDTCITTTVPSLKHSLLQC